MGEEARASGVEVAETIEAGKNERSDTPATSEWHYLHDDGPRRIFRGTLGFSLICGSIFALRGVGMEGTPLKRFGVSAFYGAYITAPSLFAAEALRKARNKDDFYNYAFAGLVGGTGLSGIQGRLSLPTMIAYGLRGALYCGVGAWTYEQIGEIQVQRRVRRRMYLEGMPLPSIRQALPRWVPFYQIPTNVEYNEAKERVEEIQEEINLIRRAITLYYEAYPEKDPEAAKNRESETKSESQS